MPYRVDLCDGIDDALDRLVELGAIDAEESHKGGIAALMPDSVAPERVAGALGVDVDDISVSPATGRDAGSVWVLSPRSVSIGGLRIVPAHAEPEPGALRLVDAAAFGTGLHPTTALSLEALEEAVRIAPPDAVLDVGTGSGVLALRALMLGVPRALGIDIDDEALRAASEN
ncbi:MAG: 50S ribosomal protein L11 methyltransferase, partial [Vicinamibacterales bacterium]